MGYPIGEVEASLREWVAANPGAAIYVLQCPDGFPAPGTGFVQTTEEYLAMASDDEAPAAHCNQRGQH